MALPPPPPIATGWQMAPSRSSVAAVPEPAKLRRALIVLFWVVAALDGLAVAAEWLRASKLDAFVEGDVSVTTMERLDNAVGVSTLLSIAVTLAAAIVLAVWSHRTASNGVARGRHNVKPGMAAGGWFIPVGVLWVPWGHLRRATGERPIRGFNAWRAWWIVGNVASQVSASVLPDTFDDGWIAAYRTSAVFSTLALIAVVLATLAARRATYDIDGWTSGRAEQAAIPS